MRWRALAILVAMAITALSTIWAEPSVRLADRNAKFSLETMVPRQFAGWAMDERQSAAIVNPEAGELVSRIYNQVSVAYLHPWSQSARRHAVDRLRRESNSFQRPACTGRLLSGRRFSDQGIRAWRNGTPAGIDTGQASGGAAPPEAGTAHLLGHHRRKAGDRRHRCQAGGLSYGLRGTIPDGIIFRVSTTGLPDDVAFATQREFVQDLFDSLPSASRKRLAGLP
jgi:hypothetical protein